jgi:hypothetical protein
VSWKKGAEGERAWRALSVSPPPNKHLIPVYKLQPPKTADTRSRHLRGHSPVLLLQPSLVLVLLVPLPPLVLVLGGGLDADGRIAMSRRGARSCVRKMERIVRISGMGKLWRP